MTNKLVSVYYSFIIQLSEVVIHIPRKPNVDKLSIDIDDNKETVDFNIYNILHLQITFTMITIFTQLETISFR